MLVARFWIYAPGFGETYRIMETKENGEIEAGLGNFSLSSADWIANNLQ